MLEIKIVKIRPCKVDGEILCRNKVDGFKLFKAARIRKDIDTGREFGIWIVTFLSVLVWDPSTGIIIGIGLNLLIECALFIKKRLKKA